MIHVCFVLHDKTGHYSKFTGTTLTSIFKNTPAQVTAHILHDDTLTDDNRDKFQYLADSYGQLVKFYNVEELCADKINKYIELVPSVKNSRVSSAAFYKFLIPEVLDADIEKVIYLDADIIVNLDLNELWKVELSDNPLAVVLEIDNGTSPSLASCLCDDGFVAEENYFNSGMMIMNLKVLRGEEDNILRGIKFRGEHPKYRLFDQEIFNYCFETRTLKLPVRFNRLIKNMRVAGALSVGKEIYHYAGDEFGLGLNMNDPFNRLWWSYFIRTAWFGVDTLDCIFKGATDSILKSSKESGGKRRVFIVDEAHAYQIERNFSVRDEEEVIVAAAESEDDFQRLIKLMSGSNGERLFFVGISNVIPKLEGAGFIEGKDFFNVAVFFSPIWMSLANNYSLIWSM